MGIFYITEVYASTLTTSYLVGAGERSSMNSMVLHYDHGPGQKDRVTGDSVDVSLVVPCMTRIASFCTLSSFSRFVCAIVVRLSPYQ